MVLPGVRDRQGDGQTYAAADGDVVAFEAGDYLLNVADVRYAMTPGAAHGCCGWQPRGEANAACACGHPVGAVHSDACWPSIVFRLIGRAVAEVES